MVELINNEHFQGHKSKEIHTYYNADYVGMLDKKLYEWSLDIVDGYHIYELTFKYSTSPLYSKASITIRSEYVDEFIRFPHGYPTIQVTTGNYELYTQLMTNRSIIVTHEWC